MSTTQAGDAMDTLTDGPVIVQYSGDSRELAEELCRLALQSHAVLCELFDVPSEVRLHIYWADRMDWETIPACRHKGSYGMPHMRCGEDHTHYVILPAANIDVPQRLMETVRPVLDPAVLTPLEREEMGQLLACLPGIASGTRLEEALASPAFYTGYLTRLILVHEIMHDFCYEYGIPENYGRQGRQAWWVFEGLAQWSVLWVQRRLDNDELARLHERLYRWMYRVGADDAGNVNPLDYANYAWFHGALVEMAVQLEEHFGQGYGPRVLDALRQRMADREYLGDADVVAVFSATAGEDLIPWFGERWEIPATQTDDSRR